MDQVRSWVTYKDGLTFHVSGGNHGHARYCMYAGQFGLRWRPLAAVDLTLRGDCTKEDEHGWPFVFREMNEAATFVGGSASRLCIFSR